MVKEESEVVNVMLEGVVACGGIEIISRLKM